MIILGIETSCDETAAAVLEQKDGRIQILSNVIASSAQLQSKYGGIIPEQAAREQLKSIVPVIDEAVKQAIEKLSNQEIEQSRNQAGNPLIAQSLNSFIANHVDAIAVTYGPGLIGSLLVGVETAKTLATVWKKPLIPVNHLIGHFYANWIYSSNPSTSLREYSLSEPKANRSVYNIPRFPAIGLLVSGGHTDLVLFKNHNEYEYLGGTRDDAAGECFDKCARILGLPYPGGPEISKLAATGDPKIFNLPSPMIHSKDFEFSFSGLKTAVANIVKDLPKTNDTLDHKIKADLALGIENAIVNVLVEKTAAAAQKHNVEQIIVAGGVAANQQLVDRLQVTADSLKFKLHIPEPKLCTDNGAMIASAAFFLPRLPAGKAGIDPIDNPLSIQANPNLSL